VTSGLVRQCSDGSIFLSFPVDHSARVETLETKNVRLFTRCWIFLHLVPAPEIVAPSSLYLERNSIHISRVSQGGCDSITRLLEGFLQLRILTLAKSFFYLHLLLCIYGVYVQQAYGTLCMSDVKAPLITVQLRKYNYPLMKANF
jgi:hypothetical protein